MYKRFLSLSVSALVAAICLYAIRVPRVYQAHVVCSGPHSTLLHNDIRAFFQAHCNQSPASVIADLQTQFPVVTHAAVRYTAHSSATLSCCVDHPSVRINDHHALTARGALIDACWFSEQALAECLKVSVADIQTAAAQAHEIVQFVQSLDSTAAHDYVIDWKHKREITLTHHTKPVSIITRYDLPLDAALLNKVHTICAKTRESQGKKKPVLLTADVRFEQQVVVSQNGRRG